MSCDNRHSLVFKELLIHAGKDKYTGEKFKEKDRKDLKTASEKGLGKNRGRQKIWEFKGGKRHWKGTKITPQVKGLHESLINQRTKDKVLTSTFLKLVNLENQPNYILESLAEMTSWSKEVGWK